ncbi:TetR/AcrR family transcriptional regulator [Gaoshiqia sp. Z1-71]|uniref:TetR/AcrR family transcriptional regulator n=1 Tax=Gaoshiqia hydrogeniformans TaxID=3290090 RepID=UPI003BF8FE3B
MITIMETARFRIVNTATRLFLRYGFKNVTIDDIACEGHLSKKTIYQHFPDKEQIISAVLQELELKAKKQLDRVLFESENPIEAFIHMYNYIFLQQFNQKNTIFQSLKKYYPIQHSLFCYTIEKLVHEKTGEQLKKGIDEGIFIPLSDIEPFCHLLYHVSYYITNNKSVLQEHNIDQAVLVKNLIYYSLWSVVTLPGMLLLEKTDENHPA